MSDATEHLLNIEEGLSKDTDGSLRDRWLKDLATEGARIKRILDAGVTPAEYRTISKMAAACEAAGIVVSGAWQRFHGAS